MNIDPQDLLGLINDYDIIDYVNAEIEGEYILTNIDENMILTYVANNLSKEILEKLNIPAHNCYIPDWDELKHIYHLQGKDAVVAIIAKQFHHATGIELK